ncbi:MAG: hypothetical protein ACTHK2_02385 [Dokdonella sp.]|uniref:hypothetical protein n=1 Tax=Dokdonella sp. TaxID=2291710 RepID=UPI003F7DBADE
MNTPKLHTVCVVGAPADVSARIHALLDEQRTRLDARWRIGDYVGAELLLIETDSVYGHMDWLKAQGSGRLVAALTATPESYEFAVRTPVDGAGLVETLNRVGAHLAGMPVAAATPAKPAAEPAPVAAVKPAAPTHAAPPRQPAAPAAPAASMARAPQPPASPAPASPAYTHVEHGRTLHLADLLGANSPFPGRLHLQANGLPDLFIDTHEQTWRSAGNLKAITPWCTRTIGHGEIQVTGEADFTKQAGSLPAQPVSRLKWLVHLVGNDGQLEAGLDPRGHYKLARWPQSEREFPKHFRIATVMLKQAATVEDIATQSGASAADVANFINAYNAVGYIESESQPDARGSGLFGRAKKTSAMS